MKEAAEDFTFRLISLSHQNCPVEIRESFAFDHSAAAQLLENIRDVFGIQEALLLSTCNRTELYYAQGPETSQVLPYLIQSRSGDSSASGWFSRLDFSEEAIRHLMRVAAGLESRVLGDFQIINQVKTAYQLSADLNMAGPYMHRLLHGIFYLNKRIVQETSFRSGSASVAYACKELVEDLLTDTSAPVAILGLGETGRSVALNLIENGFTNLVLCNRSPDKAKDLIRDSIRFVPLEEWESCMAGCRLVISALSGQHLQIRPQHLPVNTPGGFRYFIDLGVPRSIDPALEKDPRVILYNIDQIQQRVDEALELRRSAIPAVEAILEKGFAEFSDWTRDMQVSPLIQQMKQALETIRREEITRYLKKADAEQIAWAEEFSRSMMQRIIKNHVVQLKAACKRGDASGMVESIRSLFQTEAEEAGFTE
jgi:glutamyl-tRNA reductase